ncbi:Alpha/Beta hydrolase protein [Leptodontidium sp. 2 PMI_412]|nr:Alpha/Beta hydrolase protein [Leptodontidium sp. 2 PMI_412]
MAATSKEEIAADFIGFWKNFITLFSTQNRKVYIMGQSYAGYYTPYISAAMLDAANTTYWDFRGAMLISRILTGLDETLQSSVSAASFIAKNNAVLDFEEPYVDFMYNQSKVCGYDDYLSRYLVYPPAPGPLPLPFALGEDGFTSGHCDIRGYLGRAASYMNQCFDPYNILNSCPPRSNVLDSPIESGETPYFNRTDVKRPLHIPATTQWQLGGRLVFANSTDEVKQNDNSLMPTIEVLPQIVEASKRTIIITGEMDTVVLHTGIE